MHSDIFGTLKSSIKTIVLSVVKGLTYEFTYEQGTYEQCTYESILSFVLVSQTSHKKHFSTIFKGFA